MKKELAEITIEDKSYKLGFPTRLAALNAENHGLKILDLEAKPVATTFYVFYTGLLYAQPEITKEQAEEILNKFIEADGDINGLTAFLSKQYADFIASPTGQEAKKNRQTFKIVSA